MVPHPSFGEVGVAVEDRLGDVRMSSVDLSGLVSASDGARPLCRLVIRMRMSTKSRMAGLFVSSAIRRWKSLVGKSSPACPESRPARIVSISPAMNSRIRRRPLSSRCSTAAADACDLDGKAGLVDLFRLEVEELEVERQGTGRGLGVRFDDHEPATRPATHFGDAVMIDDADALTKHRSADAVALDQVGFRPEYGTDRPPVGDDLLFDLLGELLTELAAARAFDPHASGPRGGWVRGSGPSPRCRRIASVGVRASNRCVRLRRGLRCVLRWLVHVAKLLVATERTGGSAVCRSWAWPEPHWAHHAWLRNGTATSVMNRSSESSR